MICLPDGVSCAVVLAESPLLYRLKVPLQMLLGPKVKVELEA